MIDILPFAEASFLTYFLLGLTALLALFLVFSLKKTEYILYALLVWFPFETIALRYSSSEYFVAIKYFPEVLVYGTLLISWGKYIHRTGRFFPKTPLNKFFVLFLIAALCSLAFNFYNPAIWFLGIRQLLRFVVIFAVFILEDFSNEIIKNFLRIGIYIIVGESALALVQAVSGGVLDKYLFFSDSITLGPIEYDGIQQNWAPGQRVFATLGRYDRLGSLLSVGLIMLFPWFYILKGEQKEKWWVAFVVGVLALLLTYSRASWISFIAGMFTIGYFLMHDRRLFKILAFGGLVITVYLMFVIVTESLGTGTIDTAKNQSIRDRVVEAVSFYSWRQSYEGYGRFFFIVNTPMMVVREFPFFGVGPGNYGGGVAATLDNRVVYNKLHLPFGIQNIYGQIDNNWLSIWGEVGTVGLVVWALLFREIFRSAYFVQKKSDDEIQRTVAQGLCGSTIAVAILGFFGPYFEFRTLMVYYWLVVGIALYYFREHKYSWNFLRDEIL